MQISSRASHAFDAISASNPSWNILPDQPDGRISHQPIGLLPDFAFDSLPKPPFQALRWQDLGME